MRALLIDLDDTLGDDRAATARAFAALLQAHGRSVAREAFDEELGRWASLARHHWSRHERGEIGFQDQRRARVRDYLAQDLPDAEADRVFEAYLCAYEQNWQLFADVAAFLEATRGVPRVIVSNGQREQQQRKLASTGLDRHVHALVTPDDCGHWKPSSGIFEAALALVQVPAAQCMMVGDDLERDIAPARALGMHSFHVDRAAGRGLAALFRRLSGAPA